MIALLIILVASPPLFAASETCSRKGRLVLVLVNEIGFEEILSHDLPYLHALLDKSALGLVSARNIKEDPRQGALTYLSKGRRPQGNEAGADILLETLDDLGLAGLVLKGENLASAVPWAPLFFTDQEKLLAVNGLKESPFILIDLGDLLHLEKHRKVLGLEQYKALREKVLFGIDDLLKNLEEELILAREDLFIVFSPWPDRDSSEQGKKLGWLAWSKADEKKRIYSSSTRQDDLLLISDILPTILQHLEVELPANLEGQALIFKEGKLAKEDLASELKIKGDQYRHRLPYIQAFVALEVIVIFLTILALAGRLFKPFLLFLLLSHSTLLLWPILALYLSPRLTASHNIFFVLVLSLLIVLLVFKFFTPWSKRLKSILLIVHLGFWLALLFEQKYFGQSLLGYSAVIGARFYGLGNEYMGFFLGSGVMALLVGQENKKKSNFLLPSLLLMAAGVGLSIWGANFGGFLTMLAIIIVLVKKTDLWKKLWIPVFLFALLVLFELKFGKTHVGHNLASLFKGGQGGMFVQVIKDKILINKSLWAWTPWTRIFILFLLGLLVAFRQPEERGLGVFSSSPVFCQGVFALAVGSFCSLFFNDSGVVAGATTLYYPVHALFFMLLAKQST